MIPPFIYWGFNNLIALLGKFDHDLNQRPHHRWCFFIWGNHPAFYGLNSDEDHEKEDDGPRGNRGSLHQGMEVLYLEVDLRQVHHEWRTFLSAIGDFVEAKRALEEAASAAFLVGLSLLSGSERCHWWQRYRSTNRRPNSGHHRTWISLWEGSQARRWRSQAVGGCFGRWSSRSHKTESGFINLWGDAVKLWWCRKLAWQWQPVTSCSSQLELISMTSWPAWAYQKRGTSFTVLVTSQSVVGRSRCHSQQQTSFLQEFGFWDGWWCPRWIARTWCMTPLISLGLVVDISNSLMEWQIAS